MNINFKDKLTSQHFNKPNFFFLSEQKKIFFPSHRNIKRTKSIDIYMVNRYFQYIIHMTNDSVQNTAPTLNELVWLRNNWNNFVTLFYNMDA